MGFKPQMNTKCTSQPPKDQGNKARLVANGSLTQDPMENIYSGVVSLQVLGIFLGELNNLELWGADIGNAYLEANTHEKLFIIAGAEFAELEKASSNNMFSQS